VSRHELSAALDGGRGGGDKLVTAERMEALAEAYRRRGLRVVFTNGCFDLLHAGHLACLQEAAALGEVLVVALNSDASVGRLKGPGRPVVPAGQRAALVAALGCVDHVLLFDDVTPHELLRRIRPDVLAKGGTYGPEGVVGREVVETYGGRVCLTGKVDGLSTTRLLNSLRAAPAAART
jgi:D-beta-D-heptose 7-phosphate kinase/D-beta-D-heptose 1-phosphate adenosyltransferase